MKQIEQWQIECRDWKFHPSVWKVSSIVRSLIGISEEASFGRWATQDQAGMIINLLQPAAHFGLFVFAFGVT